MQENLHLKNNRLEKLEAAINFVSDKSKFEAGTKSLEMLSKFLSELLEVDYVIINKYRKQDPGEVESIAIYTPEGLAPNVVYGLAGTPCHNVIGADLCFYESNLQQLFPNDEFIIQANADSYVGIPLWDGNRAPIGLIAVMDKEGITDLKTIELVLKSISFIAGREIERIIYANKLKVSEDRFNLLTKASEDMITIHKPDGRYLYYNGPSCYAITPEDIEGKMPSDLFDKEATNTLVQAFEKVAKTGKSETIEVLLDWMGSKKWFSEYIYPVKNTDGEVVEMVKVCRDIHDRKIAEQEIETQNKALLESEKELQATVEEYHALNEELNESNEKLNTAKSKTEEIEANLRTLINTIPDLIWQKSVDGKFLFVNTRIEDLLGVKEHDIIGKTDYDFADKELADVFRENDKKAMSNGVPTVNEELLVFASDKHRELTETTKVPVLSENKNIIGVLGIGRNITEQRKAEQELVAAKEKAEGNEKKLQASIEEYEALNEELNQTNEELNATKDILIESEKDLQSLNEEYLTINEELNQTNEELNAAKNKTEESEANLRTLINTIPDLIWQKSVDGKYLFTNSRFEYFFGAKEHDIIGKTDYDFVDKELADFFRENDKIAMSNGVPTVNEEIVVFANDKHSELLETTKAPVLSENKNIIGVLGIGRNITEQRKVEDKIKKSLEEKELLLRELYHRTKNNMQVISSMLSIQSGYTDNEEVKETLEETKSRIMGMALVHEKLYQANDLSWIDLKDYITDLVELLKGSLLSKNSNIEIVTNLDNTRTNIDTAIPCGLIINELFTNAIKHGFPDNRKGVIKISLTNNGDETCISVTDNGIGIPAGIDFKNLNSYGLNSIIMLSEHQLGGSITLDTKNDTEFILKFKEPLNSERV
jgi:PAS domain S-box-containing protein